jgi:hypothetical protein
LQITAIRRVQIDVTRGLDEATAKLRKLASSIVPEFRDWLLDAIGQI